MAIYLRGGVYWMEFVWHGERVRISTKTRNKTEARQIEAAEKTNRAMGRAGIVERDAVPTLADFLKGAFADHNKLHHAAKPQTLRMYTYGAATLLAHGLGDLKLDAITNQHVTTAAAKMRAAGLAVSSVNTTIKVLRRALGLAEEWKITERRQRLSLLKGESGRTLVLSDEQIETYLAACRGAWAVMATMLAFTGMRPNEARTLRWESVSLANRTIQIHEGKTENAKRAIPIRERLYDALAAHWERAGKPQTGFVFPSTATPFKPIADYGHLHRDTCERAGIPVFVPYTFRHSALTKLGQSGCDSFTLMKIAGHHSIEMTQKYVHVQADAIRRAFDTMDRPHKTPHIVKSKKKGAA